MNSYYSTGYFYKNLFEKQIKNGLDIDVFVSVSSEFRRNDFDHGEYTVCSENYNEFDRFIFHLKQNKIYKDVRSKLNIENYSLVHAHSLFSNGYIAYRIKKEYGIPYIVAVRSTDVNLFFKRLIYLRRLGVKILSEASRIILLSKTYENHVIEKYIPENMKKKIRKKISIIPNGIDDFWFDNIADHKKKPEIPNVNILQIGHINKNKNVETTIKAVDLLIDQGYEIKFNVAGKMKNKKIIKKIKFLDYINYLGFNPKEDLVKIFEASDIFILPSVYETFGLVYAEAMSQGLPVIYSRGQGFDGQFENGEVGFSVDCFNSEDIARRVVDILENFELFSQNCINRVTKFKWSIIENQYRQIYKNIENNKAK